MLAASFPRPLQRLTEQIHGLCVFWGLTACVVLLAAQHSLQYHLPITEHLNAQVDGVSGTGYGDGRTFRFTNPHAEIELPGLSHAAHLLTLRVHNGLPDQRPLDIATTRTLIAHIQLQPGWQELHILVPADAIDQWGGTRLILETPAALGQARRMAGVPVARLELEQREAGTVPYALLGQALLCMTLLGGMLRVAGLQRSDSLLVIALALAAMALGIAAWRVETATSLPIMLVAMAWGLALALVCRVVLRQMWRTDGVWLARTLLLAVGLFIVHASGMQMPQFINIDHIARAHQLLRVAQGDYATVQAALAHQHEWGLRDVPYSLLSYKLLVPLAWLWPQADQLTVVLKITVSAIDASIPLLLYILVRSQGGRGRAAWFSALLYTALPVTHLYFHDGSYPTILGGWAVVVALLVLTRLWTVSGSWTVMAWFALSVGALVLAMLMYVMQVVFLPIVIAGAAPGAMRLDWMIGRHHGQRWLGAIGLALVIVLGVYYGAYLWPLLSSVAIELAAGMRPGYDSGQLPQLLLGSFWQQAWGHTRWLPIALAIAGLGLTTLRRKNMLASVGLGYLALLGIAMLVDARFSLWNKHWYFVLPGLAMLTAQTLNGIYERGRMARLIVASVLFYLLWESLGAWALRVFLYQWSLQTI